MQVAIGWVAILLTFGFASVCGDYFLNWPSSKCNHWNEWCITEL